MDLTTAKKYADSLVSWLAPFCDRIAIAGSVRRQRPICNDIDLVVIPTRDPAPLDLLGAAEGPRPNRLHAMLVNYVRDSALSGSAGRAATGSPSLPSLPSVKSPSWLAGETNPDGQTFILQLPKCQLDIYVATIENWGSKLVQRTGSKEHNIWLASRALSLGYRWELDSGLTRPTRLTLGLTEEEMYAALDLNFIPPVDREGGRLEQYIQRPNL